MKILIATDAFPPKCGGSGWSTFYLARALVAREHKVEIVKPLRQGRGIHTRIYDGLTVVEFGYSASNLPVVRAWQRRVGLEKDLSAYLAKRAVEFDLIHGQHLLTIPAAVKAGHMVNRPVVSTVRDYWPVCLYGTLWRDEAICPVCRENELTCCLAQKYGSAARILVPVIPLVKKELAARRRALADSDAVIAASSFVAETLRGIVQQQNLHIVPNLIDIKQNRELAQMAGSVESAPSYLLFVGKLNRLKGADLLPEILRRADTGLPLIVAGEGELSDYLSREPTIALRGWLSNPEILQLMAGATALLFPSRWAEPLARTLLEAQALGVPTVALNAGGTRDIISDNENGLLADSLDEFARGLKQLVIDPDLRARLSENARRTAEEKFSSDAISSKMEVIYDSLLTRSRRQVLPNLPVTDVQQEKTVSSAS